MGRQWATDLIVSHVTSGIVRTIYLSSGFTWANEKGSMSKNNETKCFTNYHLTPAEFGLWEICRSLSHQTGILYFNGPGIAARFKDTGKNTIYNIAAALTQKGWLRLLKDSVRRRDGMFSPRQYRVLTHEEWATEHPNQCGLTVPEIGNGTKSPFPLGDSPFPLDDSPFPNPGNILIGNTETNQPTTYPDYLKPFPKSGMDEFVGRFLKPKKRAQRCESDSGATRTGAPIPKTGQAVRDTQAEAERLSTAITNTIGSTHPEQRTEWTNGIKTLLHNGQSPEQILTVAEFAHTSFSPGTMAREGPAGFVQHFGAIEAAMLQQGERKVTQ